jgi:hypothetical protein
MTALAMSADEAGAALAARLAERAAAAALARKVRAPGVYDLPLEEYHGDCCVGPSISSSGLRAIFNQSPAHYWHESPFNPNRAEREEKDHFALGSAVHHLILGQENFRRHFVVRPDKWKDWRTDAAQAWREQERRAGRTVLEPKHVEVIEGIAESLKANSLVSAGILNGQIEKSLIFRDEETGIWLKARPDAIPADGADVVDLKTTTAVDIHSLQKSIGDFGYHMQGAMIGWALREVLKIEMASFSLVFVEKQPPYCARIVTLKPEDIALGQMQLRAALGIFARCLESGCWPGPGGTQRDAEFIDLPEWRRHQANDRLATIEQEFAA